MRPQSEQSAHYEVFDVFNITILNIIKPNLGWSPYRLLYEYVYMYLDVSPPLTVSPPAGADLEWWIQKATLQCPKETKTI